MKKVIVGAAVGLFAIAGFTVVKNMTNKNTKDAVYRVPLISAIESRNPILGSTEDTSVVVSQLQDTLFSINGDKLVPSGAAEEPKVSEDKLKYTFKIRENYWVNSKGEKQKNVTAKDYEFGFQSLANPANKSSYATIAAEGNIKNASKVAAGELPVEELGVKAVDDKTLEITLDSPAPYLTELLAYNKFSPISVENVKAKGSMEAAFKTNEDIWYSGPYYISSEKENEQYNLTKSEHYHDAKNVEIGKLEMKIFKDPESAFKEFEAGNLDHAKIIKKEDAEKMKSNTNTKKVVRGRTNYITFNQTSEVMKNENVRKAMLFGIDYSKIVEETVGVGGSGTSTLTPKGLSKAVYNEEYTTKLGEMRKYDLEKAKQFAQTAKDQLGGNVKFKYVARETANDKKLAEAIQAEAKQNLGFEIVIEFIPSKEFVGKVRKDSSSYDVLAIGWTGDYADPGTFLSIVNMENPSLNFSRNQDEKLRDLIKEANSAKTNQERLDKFAKAEKYVVEEKVYMAPMEQGGFYMATNGKYEFTTNSLKVELFRFFKVKK